MTRSAVLLAAMIAAAPLSVDAPDSLNSHKDLLGEETTIRVSGGGGSYAFIARGCNNEVIDHLPVNYREASGEVSHRFGGAPFRLGARGGWIEDRIGISSTGIITSPDSGSMRTTNYVNPFVSVESRRGSIGVGWVWHDKEFVTANIDAVSRPNHTVNDFSGHVVIGNPDQKYFAFRWMESEPLYSGGGYFTIGVGGQTPNTRLDFYGGISTGGPYEATGVMLNASYAVSSDLLVTLGGRTALGGGPSQYGLSAGFAFRRRKSRGQ